MTPAEEQTFITLWQQGASYRDIAQALGCPLGTVASRAAALVAQGKIQPRPRGGRRAQARPDGSSLPVQRPVQTTTLPAYPPGKAVRWNLWILDAIRDELATLAAERGISPSQLVQELLWTALTDRRSSTP